MHTRYAGSAHAHRQAITPAAAAAASYRHACGRGLLRRFLESLVIDGNARNMRAAQTTTRYDNVAAVRGLQSPPRKHFDSRLMRRVSIRLRIDDAEGRDEASARRRLTRRSSRVAPLPPASAVIAERFASATPFLFSGAVTRRPLPCRKSSRASGFRFLRLRLQKPLSSAEFSSFARATCRAPGLSLSLAMRYLLS